MSSNSLLLVEDPRVSSKIFFPRKTIRSSHPNSIIIKSNTYLNTDNERTSIELACFYYKVESSHEVLDAISNRLKLINSKKTLVFFHGNGELAEDHTWGAFKQSLIDSVNILFVEYRGYGSSTGYVYCC